MPYTRGYTVGAVNGARVRRGSRGPLYGGMVLTRSSSSSPPGAVTEEVTNLGKGSDLKVSLIYRVLDEVKM